MKRILLTGVTGNIGAAMTGQLLRDGHVVYALARTRASYSVCVRRVAKAIRTFSDVAVPRALETGQMVVVVADMCDQSEMSRLELPSKVDETWHFASSLKYMPRDREEILAANIDGLDNVMAAHARNAEASAMMYYIGTAFIAGRHCTRLKEERMALAESMQFNNEYERSKLEAESMFLRAVESGVLQGVVMRPAIIVGSTKSGALVNYNGYYLAVRAWTELKRYLAKNGELGQHIRVRARKDAVLNLVPVDHAIQLMLAIRDRQPPSGAVYNIANSIECSVADAVDVIAEELGLNVEVVDDEAFFGKPRSRYEKLLSYGMTYVLPYANQPPITFETTAALQASGLCMAWDLAPNLLRRLTSIFIERKMPNEASE